MYPQGNAIEASTSLIAIQRTGEQSSLHRLQLSAWRLCVTVLRGWQGRAKWMVTDWLTAEWLGAGWLFTVQWSLYVPPCLIFNISTLGPHSVFMCFVWISEQTAIIYIYSINWLVFITEIQPFTAQWSLYVPPVLTFNNSTFCPHTVYLCVLGGSQNKQPLFPYTALTDWFL